MTWLWWLVGYLVVGVLVDVSRIGPTNRTAYVLVGIDPTRVYVWAVVLWPLVVLTAPRRRR